MILSSGTFAGYQAEGSCYFRNNLIFEENKGFLVASEYFKKIAGEMFHLMGRDKLR